MSGYLELPDGGFLGVKDGLVFGRISGCDVVVNDTKASRRHARLIVESGVVEIEDMDSSNGTLLNGKPVERRMMRDGDQVGIGKTVITYREGVLPGSKKKSQSSGGSASIFDDDDDLLGGDSPAPAAPAATVRPSPSPTPPPTPAPSPPPEASPQRGGLLDDGDDLFADEPAAAKAPEPVRPSRPQPPPAAGNVVEFEDEVVEVEQAPPPVRSAPEPVVEVRKPRQDKPAGKASPAAGGGAGVSGSSGRILQYSKQSAGKNPLGDDLAQMSGGTRLLIVLGVILVGGGIAYGIMTAMS